MERRHQLTHGHAGTQVQIDKATSFSAEVGLLFGEMGSTNRRHAHGPLIGCYSLILDAMLFHSISIGDRKIAQKRGKQAKVVVRETPGRYSMIASLDLEATGVPDAVLIARA
jgi:hypothetical protein